VVEWRTTYLGKYSFDTINSLSLLADCTLKAKDPEAALVLYTRLRDDLADKEKNDPTYLKNHDISDYNRLLACRADALYGMGDSLVKLGKQEDALSVFEELMGVVSNPFYLEDSPSAPDVKARIAELKSED
jgi:tetratricopeptide (TPR) repeat protein